METPESQNFLTEHFQVAEFERSDTAKRLGIDNHVPSEFIPNLSSLCINVLEPLRAYAGEPVVISSGYRCPALNKAVGGVRNSQHLKGEAADIGSTSSPTAIKKMREWYLWILDNCPFDQLIWEKKGNARWIHVSCRQDLSENRQHSFHITKHKSRMI